MISLKASQSGWLSIRFSPSNVDLAFFLVCAYRFWEAVCNRLIKSLMPDLTRCEVLPKCSNISCFRSYPHFIVAWSWLVCSKTLFTRLWLLLPLDTGIKQPKNVETIQVTSWCQLPGTKNLVKDSISLKPFWHRFMVLWLMHRHKLRSDSKLATICQEVANTWHY